MSPSRSRPGPPPEAAPGRVPPGQVLTRKWPVLHHGEVPRMDPATWDFQVYGEVEEELRFRWDEWQTLPTGERTGDVHCVTHWSRLDNRWRGVPVREILRRARPKPTARFVLLRASGGWTTNLPLADFDRDENLFATHHDGEPLSPEHGGPLRAVIPHLYFWKSAKWVRAVELLAEDRPGFWEINGYHMHGDPWKSERFREGVEET